MSKTVEEIKKGLECCVARWAATHFASCKSDCPYSGEGAWCKNVMHSDVSTYIAQLESDNESKQKRIEELESRLAQVERERDAAVRDLNFVRSCWVCNSISKVKSETCAYCDLAWRNQFEWRGVCEENTKEDNG